MADDFNASVFVVHNAAHETLTWDNVVDVNAEPLVWNGARVYRPDLANAIFFRDRAEANKYAAGGTVQKLVGDAALILKSDNYK